MLFVMGRPCKFHSNTCCGLRSTDAHLHRDEGRHDKKPHTLPTQTTNRNNFPATKATTITSKVGKTHKHPAATFNKWQQYTVRITSQALRYCAPHSQDVVWLSGLVLLVQSACGSVGPAEIKLAQPRAEHQKVWQLGEAGIVGLSLSLTACHARA